MKKILSIVLLVALLCTSLFNFVLAEDAATRASNYFTSYGTAANAVGGGGINITFMAVGTGICNQIGVANYSVQKLHDDGHWEAVTGLLSGQTGTNVASYTFGRYFQGVAGETYRIQVSFLCVINNTSEIKSYTSGRITAK